MKPVREAGGEESGAHLPRLLSCPLILSLWLGRSARPDPTPRLPRDHHLPLQDQFPGGHPLRPARDLLFRGAGVSGVAARLHSRPGSGRGSGLTMCPCRAVCGVASCAYLFCQRKFLGFVKTNPVLSKLMATRWALDGGWGPIRVMPQTLPSRSPAPLCRPPQGLPPHLLGHQHQHSSPSSLTAPPLPAKPRTSLSPVPPTLSEPWRCHFRLSPPPPGWSWQTAASVPNSSIVPPPVIQWCGAAPPDHCPAPAPPFLPQRRPQTSGAAPWGGVRGVDGWPGADPRPPTASLCIQRWRLWSSPPSPTPLARAASWLLG